MLGDPGSVHERFRMGIFDHWSPSFRLAVPHFFLSRPLSADHRAIAAPTSLSRRSR
jgi:hypothetical protein